MWKLGRLNFREETQIKKNKLASPYQESVLEIIFSYGIQIEREVIDLAVEKKIMEKNGNWYSYQGKKLGNGKDNVLTHLL